MRAYRVVVGVDGTEAGGRALRWAVREAAAHCGVVTAVAAWHAIRAAPGRLGEHAVAMRASVGYACARPGAGRTRAAIEAAPAMMHSEKGPAAAAIRRWRRVAIHMSVVSMNNAGRPR